MSFVKFPIKISPPIQSYEELEERVKQDDANAIYWAGECFWRGENVSKNTDLASKYFQLSALMGSPNAYYKLGEMYRYGQTVNKNINLSCTVLQAAYALGVKKALNAYALILLEDVKTEESIIEGKILLKYAKNNGDDDADYYIDEYYPDADEIDANLNITEEMMKTWVVQALEGILEDIEHQIEHHYLVLGDLEFCGNEAMFFAKVGSILDEWKKENDCVIESADEEDDNISEVHSQIKYNKDNNIGFMTGTTIGIENNSSLLYGMKKFNARQAHGYAAERANHLSDLLQGKKSTILGNDNAYGGPDRCVNGVFIQSKYCATGAECIQQAFDKNGYKYTADGVPMPIEVPADAKIYNSAVKAMERRIANGEVPGVTDPAEAKNLVRRGNVTYNQAMHLAKAGTIESITYDAVNGAIVATSAFGVSAMVTFAIAIWTSKDWKEALKMSVETGLKVAGTAFVSSILSAQLIRVVNHSVAGTVIEKGADAVFKHLSPKAAEFYIRAHQCGLMNIYNEPMSHAAELFKNDLIAGSVTIALISIPSAIDLFRGRISGKQMFKNVTESAAAVTGGTIGRKIGSVVGARVIPIPKVGAFLGGLAGAALGSYFTQSASKYVLDEFIEDDAEAAKIMGEISDLINADFLKDMYASTDREQFAEEAMCDYFEDVAYNRKRVIVPEISEMLKVTNNLLDCIADKYKKIA